MSRRYAAIGYSSKTALFTDSQGNDYLHAIQMDIDSTKIPSDQSDFILVLKIPDIRTQLSATDADHFFDNAKPNGADIRAFNANGNELPIEIESVDTSNETGAVHFNVSGVLTSSSDPRYYIAYGNSNSTAYAETDTYGKHACRNSNEKMVQHMNQDPSGAAPQMIDSTSNNNDGTSNGSMVSGDLVDGQIGDALDFDGSQNIDCGDSPELEDASDLLISAWIMPDSGARAEEDTIVSKYNINSNAERTYLLRYDSNANQIDWFAGEGTNFDSAAVSIEDGNWHYIVAVFQGSDGTGGKLYVDAIDTGLSFAGNNNMIGENSNPLRIGNSPHSPGDTFFGGIDDIKIILKNSAIKQASQDWITTEYNNQSDSNNFYTLTKIAA